MALQVTTYFTYMMHRKVLMQINQRTSSSQLFNQPFQVQFLVALLLEPLHLLVLKKDSFGITQMMAVLMFFTTMAALPNG